MAKHHTMTLEEHTVTILGGLTPLHPGQLSPYESLATGAAQPTSNTSPVELVERHSMHESSALNRTTTPDMPALRSSETVGAKRVTTFYEFPKLPAELRESVYGFMLVSDKPIVPKICECARRHRDEIKFYDDNGYIADGTYGHGHGRVHTALTSIIVSKQFYEEALKVFYSCNTFSYGADVPTYFERLSHLGRFDMVHHVTLPVYFIDEKIGKKIIQTLAKNLEEQADFESSYKMKKEDESHGSLPLRMVKAHPMFHAAGLEYLGPFFMLQKLSATYAGSGFERELVLGSQAPGRFEEFKYTTWFRKVAESLGIKIKLVQADTSANLPDIRNAVHIEWKQKYQKAHLENSALQVLDKATVAKKGLDAFASHHDWTLPRATSYMRVTCREAMEWYRVRCADDDERQTEGNTSLARHRENAIQVWEQWLDEGEPTPPPSPPLIPASTAATTSSGEDGRTSTIPRQGMVRSACGILRRAPFARSFRAAIEDPLTDLTADEEDDVPSEDDRYAQETNYAINVFSIVAYEDKLFLEKEKKGQEPEIASADESKYRCDNDGRRPSPESRPMPGSFLDSDPPS